MAKNLIFGLILVCFCQIWSQKLFSQILFLLNVMHCYKLSFYVILRKTTEPHLRKWKKTQCRARFWSLWLKFGPKKLFSQILSLLDVRHCCKLSQHTISKKTNEPNLRKWQKTLVLGPLLTHLAKIWTTNFFFKNLAPPVPRYYGQLSSCTILEKTNDPILRKLSDGRADGQTDVTTEESDFIGRCPTYVEHPATLCNNCFVLHKTLNKFAKTKKGNFKKYFGNPLIK